MLLVGDGFPELDEGDVVLEGGGVVVGVDFLPLDLVVLVRELLALLLHVPLAEPHLHLLDGVRVHAVGRRHHPVLVDERAAAADALGAEQSVLHERRAPGVSSELEPHIQSSHHRKKSNEELKKKSCDKPKMFSKSPYILYSECQGLKKGRR